MPKRPNPSSHLESKWLQCYCFNDSLPNSLLGISFGDLCFAVSGLMSRISHLSAFRIWVFSLKLGLYNLVLVHAKTWYTERPCQICFFKVGCSSDDQIYFQFRSNSWKQLLWDAAHYVEMKRHLRSRVPFFNRLMFGLLLFFSCFVAALFLLN